MSPTQKAAREQTSIPARVEDAMRTSAAATLVPPSVTIKRVDFQPTPEQQGYVQEFHAYVADNAEWLEGECE
jgi:hypothetical protein